MTNNSTITSVRPGAVDFAARAELSRHFIENSVDRTSGVPYFTVFYGRPLEFRHDWPDFCDLTARYWEAAHMIRDISGQAPENTDRLGFLLLSTLAEDGLSYRPGTPYSTHAAEMFDQSRVLGALCSVYMATGDKYIRRAIVSLVNGLYAIGTRAKEGFIYVPGSRFSHGRWENLTCDPGYFVGPLIRPLLKAWELTGCEAARELAHGFARYIADFSGVFGPNGEFDDHCHSRLATACGLFLCGCLDGVPEWKDTARRAWHFARQKSGPCGFVPEYLGNHAGFFRSETCAIMDYLDLTIFLAADGEEELWTEAERTVRNHLIESQITSTHYTPDWAGTDEDELRSQNAVALRMTGGFAGWSAFDRMFGVTPVHNEAWCVCEAAKKLYLGRARVFQNCCGPAGLRALHMAWSNCAFFKDNELRVNMLFNRSIPGALIRSFDGGNGAVALEVEVDKPCDLSVHRPAWTDPHSCQTMIDGLPVNASLEAGRFVVRDLKAGSRVAIHFPRCEESVEYTVEHGAYSPETFSITFRADAAVLIEHVSGGPTDSQRAEESVLWDKYRLYERRPGDTYGKEPVPVSGECSIHWH